MDVPILENHRLYNLANELNFYLNLLNVSTADRYSLSRILFFISRLHSGIKLTKLMKKRIIID